MSERTRILLVGAAVGAAIGLVAALVATENKEARARLEESGATLSTPSATEWIRFGVAAVALLRSFADIMSPKTR
ncbi:MAG: hypothetical protein GXP42_14670 [Chloroflexi bacterium]|nr:hypothetical protein [Chloroflexota bacterium]